MDMPLPDQSILSRKAEIVARLQSVLPKNAVIHAESEVRAYECDALSAYRCPPLCAVLPASTEEVAAALRVCHEMGVPVVPRRGVWLPSVCPVTVPQREGRGPCHMRGTSLYDGTIANPPPPYGL